MGESGEIRDELIEMAKVNGYHVSAAQVRRWHLAGLLPRPEQQHLGKGRGTRSVYPAGTGEQLLALCEVHLRQGEKRLDRVAWRLWWDGYEVLMQPVRAFLSRVAKQVDRGVREFEDPDEGGLSDAAFDHIEKARDPSVRLGRPMGGARRRVGTEDFDVFMGAILRIATGSFEGLGADDDPQTEIDRRALEKGLGLERARTDRIGDNEPWLPADWAGDGLAEMSRFLGSVHWEEELGTVGDGQILEVRDQVRPWLEVMGRYAGILESSLGRGALGISVLGEVMRDAGPEDQAYFVLLWAIAGSKGPSDLREGLKANSQIDPEWLDGLDAWDLLVQLRREIPAITAALPPREFGAALKDPSRMEQLERRLAELRERHASELDAFFEVHPEYGYEVEEPAGTAPGPSENHKERR